MYLNTYGGMHSIMLGFSNYGCQEILFSKSNEGMNCWSLEILVIKLM